MKERKKLNTVLLIVLGVLIIGIIIALVMLHNINKKNEAAFNAALNDYCVQKNLRISRDGDDFVVDLPGPTWEDNANGLQTLYCEFVYAEITSLLWDHHIYKKPDYPFVRFCVYGERVATGVGGEVKKIQQ